MPGSQKRQSEGVTAATTYHLKLSLQGIEPLIWRRLQVPSNASLGWLHAVIQVAMGWTNSHLHQFVVGKQLYSDPRFELDELEGNPEVFDETKTAIAEVAPRVKSIFSYEYDFGDSWEHRIIVEKILDPDPSAAGVAQCLGGKRACPPEDCGGVGGYANLLEIIMDPKQEEYENMMEWLGGEFNPEAFDRERINTLLRKLKWPRVTERGLAHILMQRDGVKG